MNRYSRELAFTALLLIAPIAHAAKIPVTVGTPTENTDGSLLTNLAEIRVEWGSCNGIEFGVKQAGIIIPTTVPGAQLKAFIYPTGLTRICVRAFAVSSSGVVSDPTKTVVKDLLSAPAQPGTLP